MFASFDRALAAGKAGPLGDDPFGATASILLEKTEFGLTSLAAKVVASGSETLLMVEPDGADDLVILNYKSGRIAMMLVSHPVPKAELAQVCRAAWYWPDACAVISAHTAHILLNVAQAGDDGLGAALLLTKVASIVVEAVGAPAVYWDVCLQAGETFLEMSRNATRESPPALLWISLLLSKERSGRPSISTAGLTSFGLMEIEAKDSKIELMELLNLVNGFAMYLLSSGAVVKDGDTIGHSETHRIRVQHATSYWNKGQRVYRIVGKSVK